MAVGVAVVVAVIAAVAVVSVLVVVVFSQQVHQQELAARAAAAARRLQQQQQEQQRHNQNTAVAAARATRAAVAARVAAAARASGAGVESITNQARVGESGSREVASETRTVPLSSRRAIAPWSGGPSTRFGGSSTASPGASTRGHRIPRARRRHALDRVDGSRSVGVSSDQGREKGGERERER